MSHLKGAVVQQSRKALSSLKLGRVISHEQDRREQREAEEKFRNQKADEWDRDYPF